VHNYRVLLRLKASHARHSGGRRIVTSGNEAQNSRKLPDQVQAFVFPSAFDDKIRGLAVF
jgi:hypothetical protein